MNPIGIQYLFWNDVPVNRSIDLTAASGADVFECGTTVITGMDKSERKKLVRSVSDAGLKITLNGGMPGADLCSKDPGLVKQSQSLCIEAIHAASDVNSPVWGGIIYTKWLDIPDSTFTHADKDAMWERALSALGPVLKEAENCGVDVCFEVVNRFEAYMITTAAEGVRFCNDLGSKNARLLLDVFHMNIEEDNIGDAICFAQNNNRLGHLHISESNRGLPGLVPTKMNWENIAESIKSSGYSGVLTMEPMVLSQTPTSYKYRIWRDMLPSLSECPEFSDFKPEGLSNLNKEEKTLLFCAKRSVEFVKNLF